MNRIHDLTGEKFERLTVIERAENKNGRVAWLCNCECGKSVVVIAKDLKNGHTKSCGCLQREIATQRMAMRKTHGKTNTRLYHIWHGIKERCCSVNYVHYKNYGGRGITVCDEWLHDFQAFYDWALANGYADNLTIDRIDNNKGYSPDNCRWVTMKEQQNNRRNNRLITYNGKTQTISQWSEEKNINKRTLIDRLNHGWSTERALNTP